MVNMPLFVFFVLVMLVAGWYGVGLLRQWIKPGTTALRTLLYMATTLLFVFVFILGIFSLFFYWNGPLRGH